jgi:hypothetical protein
MPSAMSDEAVSAFLGAHRHRVVFLGLSEVGRPAAGGLGGQLRKRLARSGPRVLPYLALGFGLPTSRRFPGGVAVRDVNGAETAAALDAARPDLIVTLHFDQILSSATIARARLGGVNLHPSLLPRHRGPVPAFWGLLEGGTGVTLHRLAPRIDAGEIIGQRAVALPPGVSALGASRLLHLAGLPLLDEAIAGCEAGMPPRGRAVPLLPYCPFPDAATLRAAARRGVRLVRLQDLTMIRSVVGHRNDASVG